MNPDHDRLLRELASLPPIEPRREWEARVRARCHAAMAGRVSVRPNARRNLSLTAILDLAAAAALSVYLATVFIDSARLLR